jgi:hypothetical protein
LETHPVTARALETLSIDQLRPGPRNARTHSRKQLRQIADSIRLKNGAAAHLNSFELGQHGRYRTNVWQYRGVNTQKAGRLDELMLHPTVKPVAMIADAIKDVSRRGGVVLDLFGGSGSTLIAAHKTGRRARLCELDPIYCDRILHRWEVFAKDDAERIASGLPKRRTAEGVRCGSGDRREAGETAATGASSAAPRPTDDLPPDSGRPPKARSNQNGRPSGSSRARRRSSAGGRDASES